MGRAALAAMGHESSRILQNKRTFASRTSAAASVIQKFKFLVRFRSTGFEASDLALACSHFAHYSTNRKGNFHQNLQNPSACKDLCNLWNLTLQWFLETSHVLSAVQCFLEPRPKGSRRLPVAKRFVHKCIPTKYSTGSKNQQKHDRYLGRQYLPFCSCNVGLGSF